MGWPYSDFLERCINRKKLEFFRENAIHLKEISTYRLKLNTMGIYFQFEFAAPGRRPGTVLVFQVNCQT